MNILTVLTVNKLNSLFVIWCQRADQWSPDMFFPKAWAQKKTGSPCRIQSWVDPTLQEPYFCGDLSKPAMIQPWVKIIDFLMSVLQVAHD